MTPQRERLGFLASLWNAFFDVLFLFLFFLFVGFTQKYRFSESFEFLESSKLSPTYIAFLFGCHQVKAVLCVVHEAAGGRFGDEIGDNATDGRGGTLAVRKINESLLLFQAIDRS